MADLDFSNKQVVKQSQLGIPIGDKIVLGQLTSYKDGTAKWTYAKDTNPLIAGLGDRSTFTLFKDDKGKFNWTPTTSTSVSNLATREGFTAEQVTDSLYKTPQTQTVLNGGNVTLLGGINEAKKLGVPGTTGKATVTGPLPSTVSGNFAGQPGATPPAAPATPDGDVKPKSSAEDLATISGGSTGRKKFPNLRYPLNLDSSPQDKIKIEMLEYKPSTFAKETLGFQRPNVNRTPIGSVYLPIPAGISDTNNCNWGSDGEMNAAQIAAGNLAIGGITGGVDGFTSAAQEILNNAVKGSGVDLKTAASTLMAGDAAGVGGGLLKRVTGGVLNPNLELLFGGPGLRTFNFTFKMSARSEEEAKQIIGIIRFFKQGMAPQKSTTNLFVKAPHTFRLTYIHKNQTDPHRFLNRFKECALTSLTTNYTPEGQYATFYDGPMVSYEMQMQFAELDPVFNEDYTDKKGSFLGTGDSGPDTEIGF